jgi:hypothetical protein
MGLMSFERGLERFVEGFFARVFRSNLQPIEVSRRMTREMDLQRTVGVRGLVAPNVFSIAINASDFDRISGVGDRLQHELTEAAQIHAKQSDYVFLGPVQVDIQRDTALRSGHFLVSARTEEGKDTSLRGVLEMNDGSRVDIAEEAITIGRVGECDIVLADTNVSRRHAEIRREGMNFVVTDLGSTNGTRVNGVNIKERRLTDGDRIIIGNTTMKFRMVGGTS